MSDVSKEEIAFINARNSLVSYRRELEKRIAASRTVTTALEAEMQRIDQTLYEYRRVPEPPTETIDPNLQRGMGD